MKKILGLLLLAVLIAGGIYFASGKKADVVSELTSLVETVSKVIPTSDLELEGTLAATLNEDIIIFGSFFPPNLKPLFDEVKILFFGS